jgi:Undecaprenyl-phosphate glucose phosphotransferase
MENKTLYFSKNPYFLKFLFVSDLVIVNISFLSTAYLIFLLSNIKANFSSLWIYNSSWLISSLLFRLYARDILEDIEFVFRRTIRVTIFHAIIFSVFFLYYVTLSVSHKFLAFTYFSLGALLCISRFFLTYSFEFFSEKKNQSKKKIAIIGYNETGLKLARYFNKHITDYSFEGFFDNLNLNSNFSNKGLHKVVGTLDTCIDFAIQNNIDEIYSTILPDSNQYLNQLVENAEQNCVRVKFVTSETPNKKFYQTAHINHISILSSRAQPLENLKNKIKKRAFDIVLSLIVIILFLSWLIPVVGLLIKITSRGPIFFRQLRSGRNNRPFWCYKFRSMKLNDLSDKLQATKDDSRITRVGAFLRKTSLDEFPQFLNVLVGNMSLVGPRPHMLTHTEKYRILIHKYMIRHFLKPGITGWAQVKGYRGETKNTEQMAKRVDHDIWYSENWSLMLDIKIIFMTVITICKGEENAC